MAVIQFKDYKINHMKYTRNIAFDSDNEVHITNAIDFSFDVSDNVATIILEFSAGNTIDSDTPFELEVEIEGEFEYQIQEDESKIGMERLIKTNCVAILYPYLRATVSSLTLLNNELPPYIIPTINVAQMIDHSENSEN